MSDKSYIKGFGSSGYQYTNRFSLDDPIQFPSVLDELITSPDKFLNTSRGFKRAGAESMSDRTAVVSSAY